MPQPTHPEANRQSTASKLGDSRMSDKETKKSSAKTSAQPAARSQDEDVVGKVYDGRLMRRLITYLRPYKLQTAVSAACILLRSFTDVAGPLLVKVAVDTYMTPNAQPSWASRHLSPQPIPGITELAGLYLLTLALSFGLDFIQTYLMQWTGQKIMFDMRKQIFRHIQFQDVAFFDKNPVGRLVTRVTSDVDALNEMFTSGVLEIFGNVVALAFIVIIMLRMNWPVALLTLSTIPLIVLATNLFRKAVRTSYRSQRAATAKINAFTQEYVSGMSVVQLFNREKRAFDDFSAVNLENKTAWQTPSLPTPSTTQSSSSSPRSPSPSSSGRAASPSCTTSATRKATRPASSAPSPSASSSPSSSTRSASSAPSWSSRTNSTSFRPPWPPPSESSSSSTRLPTSSLPRTSKLHPPTNPAYGQIEFRNVWFTYQPLPEPTLSSDLTKNLVILNEVKDPCISPLLEAAQDPMQDPTIEWILRNVSFTIHPNETAAIVGHTGAGKTTITAS